MCGRYALGIRAAFVRYQLQQQNMPVHNAPDDDAARETYNFPPGSYGLVYRAEVPDGGLRDEADESSPQQNDNQPTEAVQDETAAEDHDISATADNKENTVTDESDAAAAPTDRAITSSQPTLTQTRRSSDLNPKFKYELKVMKWGLIPFWTKRSPDYGSMLRTINCRDDSLIENRGMWTSMKQRKRCLVIAQGFYEWLKKGPPGSKQEKIPHFVKRKDGQLMCFAGLWDCVRYEDTEEKDKLYSYTIITTDPNKQISFLHDRMPVILDPNTEAMSLWLDPTVTKWSKELQSILKPFEGELDCYPVNKDVGKVGNNSPDFIVPVDSKENKKNIANFFGNAAKKEANKKHDAKQTKELKKEEGHEEQRETKDAQSSETNAPVPVPPAAEGGIKRKVDVYDEGQSHANAKVPKLEPSTPEEYKTKSPVKPPSAKRQNQTTPSKPAVSNTTTSKKTRSATSNEGISKKPSPIKSDGTQRITSFFGSKDAG